MPRKKKVQVQEPPARVKSPEIEFVIDEEPVRPPDFRLSTSRYLYKTKIIYIKDKNGRGHK